MNYCEPGWGGGTGITHEGQVSNVQMVHDSCSRSTDSSCALLNCCSPEPSAESSANCSLQTVLTEHVLLCQRGRQKATAVQMHRLHVSVHRSPGPVYSTNSCQPYCRTYCNAYKYIDIKVKIHYQGKMCLFLTFS